MRLYDLSHPWDANAFPWFGLSTPIIQPVARHPRDRKMNIEITTNMHVGTHLDAPLHFAPGGWDMASMPLEHLVGEGVIADISHLVGELDEILPEQIEQVIEVRQGDILIIHTGWHRYYAYGPEPNEEYYVCHHPGGGPRLAQWIVEKKLKWMGIDAAAGDHPMNTGIKQARPDLAADYKTKTGRDPFVEFPPEADSAMHRIPFPHNIPHAENVGGDIEQVLNRRLTIGAFPWKWRGGDASICRIVAFDFGDQGSAADHPIQKG